MVLYNKEGQEHYTYKNTYLKIKPTLLDLKSLRAKRKSVSLPEFLADNGSCHASTISENVPCNKRETS